mmetsp:Transcript_10521/g.21648  ORF Transcript_10521/g.21648 Transcript_10521/m.21648 type:complete len:524 (-) Transcript_10521:136-1707(-)
MKKDGRVLFTFGLFLLIPFEVMVRTTKTITDSLVLFSDVAVESTSSTNKMKTDNKAEKHEVLQVVQLDILGYHGLFYPSTSQLIVEGNSSLLFWTGDIPFLCQLMTEMGHFMKNITTMHHNHISKDNDTNPPKLQKLELPRPILNLTINKCESWGGYGQGNFVFGVYIVRMAAALHKMDLIFDCKGRSEPYNYNHFLMPWFMGSWAAPQNLTDYFFPSTIPKQSEVCQKSLPLIRLDKMAKHIQQDVRSLAETLIGHQKAIPHSTIETGSKYPSQNFLMTSLSQQPLLKNVTLDDVIIHFRCGDVMGGTGRMDYGMLKFTPYHRDISSDIQTIGILTQPFSAKSLRTKDRKRATHCKIATYLLVDYLHSVLPHSVNITIRNNPRTETLPLAYARLAMAKQSFVSLSTFGMLPIIANIGESYVQTGIPSINHFNVHLPEIIPNMQLWNETILPTGDISRSLSVNDTRHNIGIGLKGVLEWFVNDDMKIQCYGNGAPCLPTGMGTNPQINWFLSNFLEKWNYTEV